MKMNQKTKLKDNKSIFMAFFIILHLISMMWYYKQSSVWCALNARIAYSIFYTSFISIGINFVIASFGRLLFLSKHFIRLHGIFIIGLGITYVLTYLGIIEITNLNRLYYTIFFLLILFLSIIYSAKLNKFFNDNSELTIIQEIEYTDKK